MALWDNTGWGNDRSEPTPQPEPEPQQDETIEATTPEEHTDWQTENDQPNEATENAEPADDGQTTIDADDDGAEEETADESEEDDATADDTEAKTDTDTEHDDESKRGRGKGKTGGKGRMPKLDQWNAQKIGELWDAFKSPANVAVAKLLLESNASSPAVLVSLMTEPKNQKRVNAAVTRIRKLFVPDDQLGTAMNLQETFIEDPGFAKTLVGLLRAAAPDHGFVNASGNPKADAKNIAARWDASIDLSMIDALRI